MEQETHVTDTIVATHTPNAENQGGSSSFTVVTEIVHDGRIWTAGEVVDLPTETGLGLTQTGDVKPNATTGGSNE